MDFIGPFSKTNKGHDNLLVITDILTKTIIYIPTTIKVSAKETARLFLKNIWRKYGLPLKIISDQGPQFENVFTKALCSMLQIEQNLSTAYHPQTDGQVERSHQETATYLRHFINHKQDDWDEWLPLAEFMYNNRTHTVTKKTPFEALLGFHPQSRQPRGDSNSPAANDHLKDICEVQKEIKAAIEYAQNIQKKGEARDEKSDRTFKFEDQVWLEAI